MKNLNTTKRTRLKAMFYTNLFLAIVTLISIHYGLETLATTCVAGILTVTTMFIGGDSYRESSKEENIH